MKTGQLAFAISRQFAKGRASLESFAFQPVRF